MKMRFLFFIILTAAAVCSFAAEVKLKDISLVVPENYRNIEFMKADSLGDMLFSQWKSDKDKSFEVLIFNSDTEIDRGPATFEHSEQVDIGSFEIELNEVSMLFGMEIAAYVVYLNILGTRYMIVGEKMSKSEFIQIITTLKYG